MLYFAHMIKGKLPYPFETIALAVSFSPGLPLLISEMKRLSQLHSSQSIFIHVGKKTGEKQRELAGLLSANGFHDGNSRIYWEQEDILKSILRVCKHEVVDLLIAGASDRENFNPPVGKMASSLAKQAKCSVLIYKGFLSTKFSKIVVNGADHEKAELTLLTSLYFAEKENISEIYISEDNRTSEFEESQSNYSNKTIDEPILSQAAINMTKVNVIVFSLAKESCSTLSEYAFKNKTDLIITLSSDHHLLIFDRISSSDGIDNLLTDLSCSLLIVHSRLPE